MLAARELTIRLAVVLGMCSICVRCADDDADRPRTRQRDAGSQDAAKDPVRDAEADAAKVVTVSADDWLVFGGDLLQCNARTQSDMWSGEKLSELHHAWSIPAPGVTGTPVVHNGIVYWADWMGGVYAVAAESGEMKWNVTLQRGFTSSLTFDSGRLYLGDRDGRVYALNPDNGDVIWEKRLDDNSLAQVWSSPVVAH